MTSTIAQKWFGEHFSKLHPKLQTLHTRGGVMQGEVNVEYGRGMGEMLGKRLGRKLGLPLSSGLTSLKVEITHTEDSMIWSRQFGEATKPMVSIFTPEGCYTQGCWRETTGNITIELGVEIQNGEWHWIQRATRMNSFPVPAFLLPVLKAKKSVEGEEYRFEVELTKSGLGMLLRYSGTLVDQ